jgi:hypothetical protein
MKKLKNYPKLPKLEIVELIDILYTRIYFISEEYIPKEIFEYSDSFGMM